jgi:hypothetical protein
MAKLIIMSNQFLLWHDLGVDICQEFFAGSNEFLGIIRNFKNKNGISGISKKNAISGISRYFRNFWEFQQYLRNSRNFWKFLKMSRNFKNKNGISVIFEVI